MGQARTLRQAAIAFYALPEPIAREVAERLDDELLAEFGRALLSEGVITRSDVEAALGTLAERYREDDVLAECRPERLEAWLERIAPGERAKHLASEVLAEGASPFQQLEPTELAALLAEEHPMVAAVVLERLDPAAASEVLVHLPERHRHAAALRLVQRVPIPATYVEAATTAFEAYMAERRERGVRAVGGPVVLGTILRKVPREVREQITQRILELDPTGAENLERALLDIEDLLLLSPQDMAVLVQKVDRGTLLLALSMAPNPVKEAVAASMTQRAARMFLEDLESVGRKPVEEVEKAQREVMRTMWALVDEGVIQLQGEGA